MLRKGMDGSTGSGIMSIRAVAWVGSFSPAQHTVVDRNGEQNAGIYVVVVPS